jgi:sirohydrochlorin cobaltochelatase
MLKWRLKKGETEINNVNNTTVLLVAHGSRYANNKKDSERFCRELQHHYPNKHITLCFLERISPSLEEGLHQAATHSLHVIVVPLILGAAKHARIDIPHRVHQAQHLHPHTTFLISPHLGAVDKVLHALLFQLQRVLLDEKQNDDATTGVVVIGRGSSDQAANGEVAKMARWMFESSLYGRVDVAFSGMAEPPLKTVVQRQIQCGMTKVIVLPYYLFWGVLMERMAEQMQQFRHAYPTITMKLAQPMAFSPSIYSLVGQRIVEKE